MYNLNIWLTYKYTVQVKKKSIVHYIYITKKFDSKYMYVNDKHKSRVSISDPPVRDWMKKKKRFHIL